MKSSRCSTDVCVYVCVCVVGAIDKIGAKALTETGPGPSLDVDVLIGRWRRPQ